jgi:predicted metalloprotease with PDZ domain
LRFGTWLLAVAAPLAAWAQGRVGYHVAFTDPEHHLVHVRVELPASSAERRLQFPVWNALYQVRDFSQNVRNLHAEDETRQLIALHELDPSAWEIPVGPGAEVEYDVYLNDAGPYGAEFNRTHAFLNWAEVLPYVAESRSAPVTVELEGIPSAWGVATTLPETAHSDGSETFAAVNYDALVDAPVEVGRFHESSFALDGAKVRIAVEGSPADYDASRLQETVRKIVAAGIAWMQDRPFDEYLFIYHIHRSADAGGGMEHANSCVIDVDARELALDPLHLERVTAHEFFHLWNVKRIRPASLDPVDYTRENDTRALWFSEGVTNTVASILLVRAGLVNEPQFLSDLANQVRNLELSPARQYQSAEEASLNAWLEKYPRYRAPERSISYYTKGEVLGVLLDLELRRVSDGKESLRDVFLWMNQHYAKQGRFFRDSAGVQEACQAVTGKDLSSFFFKYVAGTATLPYDDLLATVGLQLAATRSAMAQPGFEFVESSNSAKVVEVDDGSEAARAGLAVGDTILKVNGNPGRELAEIVATLHPGDTISLATQGAHGKRGLKIKLGSREEERVEITDLANVTLAQRNRRAAWLNGEDER